MPAFLRTLRRFEFLTPVIVPLFAVLAALLVGSVFLLALNADPIKVYSKLVNGAFGNTYNITQTIGKATPLLLVAVGACIAFRASVFNIGVEGQVIVGGLATTAAAINFRMLPGPLLIAFSLLVGAIAGMIWGGIPGALKAWFGVNEILTTIMMNQIAAQLLIVLLTGPMKDSSASATSANIIQTAQIPDIAWLPRFDPKYSFLHLGAVIAVVAAIVVYFFLWRTVAGYRIRAVGFNPDASRYAGIQVKQTMILAMVLSGALAGLAGGVEVLGVTHRSIQDFSTGYGFSGIVVALFGSLHPLGAIPASVLFGGLVVSGTKLQSAGISSSMVTVLEGLIVLFVVGSSQLRSRSRGRVSEPPRAAEVTETTQVPPVKEASEQYG